MQPGEFLSLLGPSGCGKSTTLAMVAGFVQPDAGRIVVNGRLVNDVAPAKRRVGIVFQDYAVFSRLTVRDNLLFGLEAQKVPRPERLKRLDWIIDRVDLAGLIDRRGSALNVSEMQRVALARVLVTNPELLLLDEPMSNLDAADRFALRSELKRIQKDLGQSVLYVTHDQVEAMSMSDRIAIMRDGEILQIGTPEEIYHHPSNRFVAEFIGDPPINLLSCEVKTRGGEIIVHTRAIEAIRLGRGRIPHHEYLLAVRPHDLTLAPASDDGAAGIVRFVENFGAEDVAHVQYGEELVAIVTAHQRVRVEDRVDTIINAHRAHLIDRRSGAVIVIDREGTGP